MPPMSNGHFCRSDPLDPRRAQHQAARLRSHRLNVPRRDEARSASGQSAALLSEHLNQVDWKATLDGTEQVKTITELSQSIARRGAGLMAFRRKYYKIFADEVGKNRAGDLRGITVSAKWSKVFSGLGKFGAALEIAGIPLKAASLSWEDLSARGISANLMTTMAQWGTESVVLGLSRTAQLSIEGVGWATGSLGFKEAANDIKKFSAALDGTLNDVQQTIDNTLSVANARDVLTWDRSVINPRNWSLVADGVQSHFEDLTKKTHHLYDAVVDSIASHM